MAENKRQHFVPQFYMRKFSVDAERKLISLYVIDGERHVPAASIRDQAYEDYFYGKAGVEDDLKELEAVVSPIIAKAIGENALPERMSEGHRAHVDVRSVSGCPHPGQSGHNERTSGEAHKKDR